MEMNFEIKTAADEFEFELAEAGLEKGKVAHIGLELEVLRKKGLLIDLNISGMGMFQRSASFEELGIVSGDEKTKRYTPGSKFLIPKDDVDKLRSVETRMRQSLDKYCWDITGFRPYKWLPWTAYKQFKERWTDLLDEFQGIKADILIKYDLYLDKISQEFAAGARQTWKSIIGQGYTSIIWQGRGYLSEAEFVDGVVKVAQSLMPSYPYIENNLHADYRVGLVYGQQDYAADQAQADLEMTAAKSKIQVEQAKVAQEQLKLQHEANMYKLEKEAKELEIEQMLAAEMEHARQQLEQTRSPFEEVFTHMRSRIAQDCQNMLDSIKKNGFVRGKVAEKGRGLVELYELLSVHDDRELRLKLIELRNQIGIVGERDANTPTRSTEQIADTLSQIVDMAHENVEMITSLSRASFLEL